MSDSQGRRSFFWPAAFFLLNACALVLWFYLSGFFFPRELALRSVTPKGTEINPATIDKIDVEFDSPLDPASVSENAITLMPSTPGKTELLDGRILRFRPVEKLKPATAYRVTWSPKLRGKYGQTAPQELVGFSTTRFAFMNARQAAFDRYSYTLELTFNQPIRAADLEAAIKSRFSLPYQGGSSDRVRVIGTGTSTSHQVRIAETRASFVELTLPAGTAGTNGSLGLKDDVSLVCKLAGVDAGAAVLPPEWAVADKVIELKPVLSFAGMNADWDNASGSVIVRMTAPLDVESARRHVVVEPSVEVSFVSTWNGLKIQGDFKPGRQYRVTLKPGLSAGDAGELGEEISRNVWFDDLPAKAAFTFGGGYLRPDGLLKVPVTSTNVETLTVNARRLYPNNIVETTLRGYEDEVEEDYGAPAKETKITPEKRANQPVETILDLRKLVDGEVNGVYGLEMRRDDSYWRRENALVVVSDIGLTARFTSGQLFAWMLSLGEGTPIADGTVKVYSNRRQLLAEGKTGKDGTIALSLPALPAGESAALVLAESKGQITFVRLDRGLNSRGGGTTDGVAYPGEYQVFVAPDRGVYRGGETVRISALVRDGKAGTTPPMPLELVLRGPDGKEKSKQQKISRESGLLTADVALPGDAPGGVYAVELRLPGESAAIGAADFRLADYIPETMRLAVDMTKDPEYDAPKQLDIKTERLAGGEVGVLEGRALAIYTTGAFKPDKWKNWHFGDYRLGAGARERRERPFQTSVDGTARAEWENPALSTPATVLLSVRVEVMEPGGRAISAGAEQVLHPLPYYVGILGERDYYKPGEDIEISLAAVDPEGQAFSPEDGWKATVYRIEYSNLLKRNSDGRLVYEWKRREVLEREAEGTWSDGRAKAALGSLTGGRFRLVVESDGGKAATYDFGVTGDGNDWVQEDPELLEVAFERPTHAVGDTAKAVIKAPFAGKALITLETDKVLRHWVKEFEAGENTVEIPVEDDMRPNAFAAITLVRPTKAEAEWRPHRAYGAARLDVDNAERKLRCAISTEDSFAPGGKAEIAVSVNGSDGKPKAGAAVVAWGVDEGVLSLTDFATPSPWDYFYARRRLGVSDADMYSRLAPELEEWKGAKDPSPGGDGDGGAEFARRLSPVTAERVKAAIVYVGALVTDENGVAKAEFSVPEAATKLRLMAWAADGDAMGSAERETEIKAPILLVSSWPRFAAPGDEFTAHVTLINRSGEKGEAVLSVGGSGLEFSPPETTVPLGDEESKTVTIAVKAGEVGVAKAELTAKLGDASFKESIELPIRPPVLFQRLSGVVEVKAGTKASFEVGKGLMRAGGRVKVMAAGSPQVKLAGSLEYLLDYPYGCAEQTASRLAGLLFLPDLLDLSRPGQLGKDETMRLVSANMARLAIMQNRNGGFRLWPDGGDSAFWASAHILYILEEAKAAGAEVPDQMLRSCRGYLKDNLDGEMSALASPEAAKRLTDSRRFSGEDVALACLSLAKGNDIRRSWLVRLAEIAEAREKTEWPLSPSSMAFLCEAIAVAGEPAEAKALFDRVGPGAAKFGVGSMPAMDKAAWIQTGLRLGVPAESLVPVVNELERGLSDSYIGWTTRENAWTLMALGKYWRAFRPNPSTVAWMSVGGEEKTFPARQGAVWEKLAPGTVVEAEAKEGGSYFVCWLAEGVPLAGKATEEDAGMRLRRRVFDRSGNELHPPFRFEQGDVYEIRLELNGSADDLALADLLPAGLEIEDPNLKGMNLTEQDGPRISPDQVEIKDDRLLVFGSVWSRGVYSYLARAVTPGTYVWPAADASRMYDPATRSVNGSGTLTVEKPGPKG